VERVGWILTICVGVGLMTTMLLLGPLGSREVLMIDAIGQAMRALTILGLFGVGVTFVVVSCCAGLDPMRCLAGCACLYLAMNHR
jgi:hypothetical protein